MGEPLDLSDYSQRLSASQVQRLMAVFSNGVCDYSKRGIEAESIAITWLAYPTPGTFRQLKGTALLANTLTICHTDQSSAGRERIGE